MHCKHVKPAQHVVSSGQHHWLRPAAKVSAWQPTQADPHGRHRIQLLRVMRPWVF